MGGVVRVDERLVDVADDHLLVLALGLQLLLLDLLLFDRRRLIFVHAQVPAERRLALEGPIAELTLQLARLLAVSVVQVLCQPPVRLKLRVANVTPTRTATNLVYFGALIDDNIYGQRCTNLFFVR